MWRFPLVRVLPFFIIGLLAGRFLPGGLPALVALAVPFGLALLWRPYRTFAAVAICAIALGWTDTRLHDERRFANHYIHFDQNAPHAFIATVTERLRPSNYYTRLVVTLSAIDRKEACGKLLVCLPKKGMLTLYPGDQLVVRGRMNRARPPAQPSDFNYGDYLANKSIYATLYPKPGDWRVAPSASPTFGRAIAVMQQRLERSFRRQGMGETELQVLMALVLGKQLDIPKETLADYQYAGAVHILSVSGLHVGLLLGFVLFCLRPLPQSRKWNLLRFTLVLLFLWGFACVAGLSPSVIRSATMFSFVAGGTLLRKDGNLLHTLCVSMLVILAVSPGFLYDAGFQLSYLSLFFIVWLQPFFDRIAPFENRMLRYIWGLLAVSFSAQLGVLPLSLYYFHQFPGLFFLTNLLIVPVLGIIMAAGVVSMVGALLGFLPSWFVLIVDRLLWAMNEVIHRIASIDGMVIRDVYFPLSMLLMGYLAIAALSGALRHPSYRTIQVAAISVLCLQATVFFQNQQYTGRDAFYVMQRPRTTEYLAIRGRTGYLASTAAVSRQGGLKSALGLDTIGVRPLQNCLYAAGKRILVIDSSGCFAGKPDIVIMTGSPRLNFERMLRQLHPQEVVADGSNYKSYVTRWRATCHKMKIPFHATAEKGFYCRE